MATVLMTGANRGIGLALARLYQARGDAVVAVCREVSDELAALGVDVLAGVDVTAADAGPRVAAALAGRSIDVVINNAGVFGDNTLGTLDFDDVLRQFAVNAMGPLRLTEALLPLMGPGGKVAMVTSRMGSIASNSSGGYYAYRMSKAALNAAGVSLARDLAPRGIAVVLLHPGFVQTRMVGFAGDITPEQSAAGLAARIDALDLASSGSFWHSNGQALPW
jgi:NAD(P)-dependent dehydrogenase (short-subunit alcohol dehydrogenase family)